MDVLAGESLMVVVTELPLAAVALDVVLANLSLLLHCTVMTVGTAVSLQEEKTFSMYGCIRISSLY